MNEDNCCAGMSFAVCFRLQHKVFVNLHYVKPTFVVACQFKLRFEVEFEPLVFHTD